MARKTVIIHICDRCGHHQDSPLPASIKIQYDSKKSKAWDLCTGCAEGLGDFLVSAVHVNADTGDGMD